MRGNHAFVPLYFSTCVCHSLYYSVMVEKIERIQKVLRIISILSALSLPLHSTLSSLFLNPFLFCLSSVRIPCTSLPPPPPSFPSSFVGLSLLFLLLSRLLSLLLFPDVDISVSVSILSLPTFGLHLSLSLRCFCLFYISFFHCALCAVISPCHCSVLTLCLCFAPCWSLPPSPFSVLCSSVSALSA
jgi:hypothetical protein